MSLKENVLNPETNDAQRTARKEQSTDPCETWC